MGSVKGVSEGRPIPSLRGARSWPLAIAHSGGIRESSAKASPLLSPVRSEVICGGLSKTRSTCHCESLGLRVLPLREQNGTALLPSQHHLAQRVV